MTHHMMNPGARAAAGVQISSAAVNCTLVDHNTPIGCAGQAGWRHCRHGGICKCLQRQIEAEPEAARPIPPFTTLAAEADAWATFASDRALKTYIAAAVARLPARDRLRLVDYLQKASG